MQTAQERSSVRVGLSVCMLGLAWSVTGAAHAQISDVTRRATQALAGAPAQIASGVQPAGSLGQDASAPDTLQVALDRLAGQAHWRVVWQAVPVVALASPAAPTGDFVDSARQLIAQARASGHPVMGTAYSDRTLVVSVEPTPAAARVAVEMSPAAPARSALPAAQPMVGRPATVAPSPALPAIASNAPATAAQWANAARISAPPLPAVTAVPPVATASATIPPAALVPVPPLAVSAPPPALPRWQINKGEQIDQALVRWADKAGWTLLWYPPMTWKSVANVSMDSERDVVAAVSEVISILRDEGKPVQLRVSEGNSVMEVLSTEVRND